MLPKSYQYPVPLLLLLAAACGCAPQPAVDPQLAAEIGRIRAIDNHAHPGRARLAGEAPGHGYDALMVENLEPASDPLNLRPDAPPRRRPTRAVRFGRQGGCDGLSHPPATLGEYLARVVTPTLERHRQGGAVAEKFEAACLRSLAFDAVDGATAGRIYARYIARPAPGQLFRRRWANRLLLERVLDNSALRRTRFVMLHVG
jgi:hypothetical protein